MEYEISIFSERLNIKKKMALDTLEKGKDHLLHFHAPPGSAVFQVLQTISKKTVKFPL